MQRRRLGIVTGGTFNDGLSVRLDAGTDTEDLRIGSFCIVEGREFRYFSTIQDLRLHATDSNLMADPPRNLSPLIRDVLSGTTTYAVADVKPTLMMPRYDERTIVGEGAGGVQPVKTIPLHFAELVEARAGDFVDVFGKETEDGTAFALGTPLTMEIPVCIKLDRLVERSTGIFGSTGTGKSFLTRILLAGIITKEVAVTLIFDMHDEYATGKQSEEGEWVKGLRELFGAGRVALFSLDDKKSNVDQHIVIGLDQIQSGDILLLSEELGLSSTTTETNIALLERRLGTTWLRPFLQLESGDIDELAGEIGAHPGSLQALWRKLNRLQRSDYIRPTSSFDQIDAILDYLDNGRHVIVQFGRHNSLLDYILVANIITRRIRSRYEDKVETYHQTRKPGDKPRPLVITVEEAHKFLSPELARQTIFGTIARELRKYFVTLLTVDQRPSGIDDEILSQLGTRISGRLNDQRDLDAVLTGVADRKTVRGMLTTLDTKQQVVVFGHAAPMPVQLRTRRYDETFYRQIGAPGGSRPTDTSSTMDDLIADLYG